MVDVHPGEPGFLTERAVKVSTFQRIYRAARARLPTVPQLGTVMMMTYLPMALFAVGIVAIMPLLVQTLDQRANGLAVKISDPQTLEALHDYAQSAKLPFLWATGVAAVFAAFGAFVTYWARHHVEGRIRVIAEYIERLDRPNDHHEAPAAIGMDVPDSLGRLATDMDTIARQVRERDNRLRIEAERQKFEAQVQKGLAMAQSEPELLDLVGRALGQVSPGTPNELLLLDPNETNLHEAVTSKKPPGPGCPVRAPGECAAVRRGHSMVFQDGRALDACPKLLARENPAETALCVPIGVMGNTMGILHATAKSEAPFSYDTIEMYKSVARNVGSRLGMIRALRNSQLQAETDSLTGLVNRRSLDNRFGMLTGAHSTLSLVMGDLDNFKKLNDSYGHEAGDRALVLFSHVIKDVIRPSDLAARFGGEEFVVILPGAAIDDAVNVVERVRNKLKQAIDRAGCPSFTASYGISSTDDYGWDLASMVHAADQAMYRAKRAGRDRIVKAASLHSVDFSGQSQDVSAEEASESPPALSVSESA